MSKSPGLVALALAFVWSAGCIEFSEMVNGLPRPTSTPAATPDTATDETAAESESAGTTTADADTIAEDADASTADATADADAATAEEDAAEQTPDEAAGPSPDLQEPSADETTDSENTEETGVPALPEGAELTTSPSGLRYYDYVVGDGAQPQVESTVTVAYVGYLEDGTIFDSSESAPLNVLGLIPGFSEGVTGMREGGRRRLVIPPDLGYGPSGGSQDGQIGPDDTIIFDVTLISVDA